MEEIGGEDCAKTISWVFVGKEIVRFVLGFIFFIFVYAGGSTEGMRVGCVCLFVCVCVCVCLCVCVCACVRVCLCCVWETPCHSYMCVHVVMQYTGTHCNTLQHTAAHCNTLQHTATHCNTLQHTATHCSTHINRHMCVHVVMHI